MAPLFLQDLRYISVKTWARFSDSEDILELDFVIFGVRMCGFPCGDYGLIIVFFPPSMLFIP